MSKKVVLVYPQHTTGWQAQPWVDMPMGLLCVATLADRAGYEIKIIDQRIELEWYTILMQELEKNLLCLGISTSTGPQLQYALEISRIAKECGNVPVVWGGVHPSILPEQTLQNEYIDIIVQGEGEETFLELLQALEGKKPLSMVKGIWYKDKGSINYTGMRPYLDLSQQPPLPYHLIEVEKYIKTVFNTKRLSFFTSRGCPHQCKFCFNTVFNRRKWRAMEPDLAVRRIKGFVQKYDTKGLTLYDSNFFVDLDRARRILKGIIRENLDIVITRINIRADTLSKMNENDFELLEKAGCKCITIGVESGSDRIQSLLKKSIDISSLLEINRNLKKFSITPLYLFMMGLPTETRKDMEKTFTLVLKLLKENPNATKSINIYTPFPGTELFDVAVKLGLQVPQRIEDWVPFNYRNLTQNTPWVSRDMRKLIEVLDFCSFFVGKKTFLQPYKKTHPLVIFLSNLYAPVAEKRLKSFYYHFPLEVKLAKFFRIYAKQD